MAAKDLTAIGLEILQTARNELYLNLPYLDVALCSLDFQPGGGVTLSLATDGETLYYDGSFLADRYRRSCGTWPAMSRWRASWTSWTTPAWPGASSPPSRSSTASAGQRCRC